MSLCEGSVRLFEVRRRSPRAAGWLMLVACAAGVAAAQPAPVPVSIPGRLTLAEAESLLLQRNLAIAVNRRQLEAAEAARLIASFKPNPTIQLGAEQISIASPIPGAAPRFFETNSNAGANSVYTFLFAKVIERGGKRELRTRQADAQVAAAKSQILETYRQQLLQLRQAYGAALLARLNFELAGQTLREYEQTEKLTETRVQAGDIPQVELYRVRSSKLPYQQAALQAESGYRQAALDVLGLLNSEKAEVVLQPATQPARQGSPAAVLELVGDFADQVPLLLLDELKRAGLQERPDIEVARHLHDAAQFGSRLAAAQRTRDISVGTEYQRVGDDSSVGVIASFPLFVYNNQKANMAQASALEHAAELQLRQTERQAITDIEKAWERYQAAQRALKVFSADNIQQAENLRRVAFFSYQQGATSLFELLDVQRTLLLARIGYNQARFDLQSSLWMLEAATGHSLL